jgi:hypothetical protein
MNPSVEIWGLLLGDVIISLMSPSRIYHVYLLFPVVQVGILCDLRHPNTILFMGACLEGPEKFIVTE